MVRKYTQLNELDRKSIECMLNQKKSLSSFAKTLGRDISGIRREIQRNSLIWEKANPGSYLNDCALCDSCRKRHIAVIALLKGVLVVGVLCVTLIALIFNSLFVTHS